MQNTLLPKDNINYLLQYFNTDSILKHTHLILHSPCSSGPQAWSTGSSSSGPHKAAKRHQLGLQFFLRLDFERIPFKLKLLLAEMSFLHTVDQWTSFFPATTQRLPLIPSWLFPRGCSVSCDVGLPKMATYFIKASREEHLLAGQVLELFAA